MSLVLDCMVINSDASRYQHALSRCKGLIEEYDAVCIFHTEGVCYDFQQHEYLRSELLDSIFNRDKIVDALQQHDRGLVALKGYMAPSHGAIDHFSNLAASAGITTPSIRYAATLTLYAVSSTVLGDLMDCIPAMILIENLLSAGENRYFFEDMIPSLLTAEGAKPIFLMASSSKVA